MRDPESLPGAGMKCCVLISAVCPRRERETEIFECLGVGLVWERKFANIHMYLHFYHRVNLVRSGEQGIEEIPQGKENSKVPK